MSKTHIPIPISNFSCIAESYHPNNVWLVLNFRLLKYVAVNIKKNFRLMPDIYYTKGVCVNNTIYKMYHFLNERPLNYLTLLLIWFIDFCIESSGIEFVYLIHLCVKYARYRSGTLFRYHIYRICIIPFYYAQWLVTCYILNKVCLFINGSSRFQNSNILLHLIDLF